MARSGNVHLRLSQERRQAMKAWAQTPEAERSRRDRRRTKDNDALIRTVAGRLQVFFDIEVSIARVKGGWTVSHQRHGVLYGPAEGRHILAFLAGLQWGVTCRVPNVRPKREFWTLMMDIDERHKGR